MYEHKESIAYPFAVREQRTSYQVQLKMAHQRAHLLTIKTNKDTFMHYAIMT